MPERPLERTNDEWLAALRDSPDERAVSDLNTYIRKSLASALAKKGPVDDSELDDYTQEAVLRVLNKLETFRGKSRFTTWAVTVAVRVAFTALRRRRWNAVSLEDLELSARTQRPIGGAAPPINPYRASERNDLLEALNHAIDHDLSDRQRTVVLAELAGMPTSEMVVQLGSKPNALYKVHHDARKKLRWALEESGFSAEDVRLQLAEASNEI